MERKFLFYLFGIYSGFCCGQNDTSKSIIKRQNSEFSLTYNLGISTRNYQIPDNTFLERLDYTKAHSLYDQIVSLKYNYSILHQGKKKLVIGTGIGFSQSKYYQFIVDEKYDYLLETVKFDSKTISIPILIGGEWELINDKLLLELDYSLNYNLPIIQNTIYFNSVEKKYDFIDYSYTLTVSPPKKQYHPWGVPNTQIKIEQFSLPKHFTEFFIT